MIIDNSKNTTSVPSSNKRIKLANVDGHPEIFYSIQGEGPSIGVPSTFIRLTYCNLFCTWCDTDYTWNWQGTPFYHRNQEISGYEKFNKEAEIIPFDIRSTVDEILKYPANNIVLTGGEPLLQDELLAIVMEHLKQERPSMRFEIETNGTIIPCETFDQFINQYTVSIKLNNSGNDKRRINTKAIQFFSKNSKSRFKFVIANQDDLNEVLLLKKYYNLSEKNIWLMPLGSSESELNVIQTEVAQMCLDHQFNYSDRLHLRLYGNTKGT